MGNAAALPVIAVWDGEDADHQWQTHGPQGSDDVTALVRCSYLRLSPTERRVADLVLADAAEVSRTSTAGLARNVGISQSQVIRFRRRLGASLALQAASLNLQAQ